MSPGEDLSPLPAYAPEWIGPPVEGEDEAEDDGKDEGGVVSDTGAIDGDPGPGVIAPKPETERVLLVQPVAATTRLIRETLENFTRAEVVCTSDPLRGFELALQREFRLFLFGMQVGELGGPTLYELISKAYACDHGPKRLAPGVVFIREEGDPKLTEELSRDVRVKDVISKPVKIDRLLKAVAGAIEVRDPTAR